MKKRRLRSINEIVNSIKIEDPKTAVTRYMIVTLINNNEVFYKKIGNKILIDYDEVLKKLGLIYE